MICIILDQVYIFNFGLKGLIMLPSLLNLNEEDNLSSLVFCALLKNHPSITMDEAKKIAEHLTDDQITALKNLYAIYDSPTQIEVAELYAKIVGEVGIQPSDFWQMSLREIEECYRGFSKRKEDEVNLIVTAMRWVKNNNSDLIKLTKDLGYEIGSLKEREQVFNTLGIEVN